MTRAVLSPGRERCDRFAHLHVGTGPVRRMREQKFEIPDIARLVRRATAGDRMAWERPVDLDARLIPTGTPEFTRVAPLRAAPASAGSWCPWLPYVAWLAKGVLRQGCS